MKTLKATTMKGAYMEKKLRCGNYAANTGRQIIIRHFFLKRNIYSLLKKQVMFRFEQRTFAVQGVFVFQT